MLRVDHIGIPAHDARASATALAEILGAPEPATDGADGDMFRVELEDGSFILFSPAPSGKVNVVHVAFRVDEARFAAIVKRLGERSIPFGNEPDDTRNGRTDDPLGGAGRVYFVDANHHLFEVTC
jgi:catechol 2,3-dioxygenase-like lactoylglutathione lyase family enzyme